MKNLKKLLFAAVLIGAAVVSAPKTALAVDGVGCGVCASRGGSNCQDFCLCEGGGAVYCAIICDP